MWRALQPNRRGLSLDWLVKLSVICTTIVAYWTCLHAYRWTFRPWFVSSSIEYYIQPWNSQLNHGNTINCLMSCFLSNNWTRKTKLHNSLQLLPWWCTWTYCCMLCSFCILASHLPWLHSQCRCCCFSKLSRPNTKEETTQLTQLSNNVYQIIVNNANGRTHHQTFPCHRRTRTCTILQKL